MRGAVIAIVLASAACTRPPTKVAAPLADQVSAGTGDRVEQMRAELQDEILESYDRDDPPDTRTGMLSPAVGGARIGVAADDVLIGDELAKAPTRWPIDVDHDTPFRVLSKHLEVHFAKDKDTTAAWMSDELSWRVTMCGRVAVIPLRITALYAHDGDRWIEVFEHLSFAHKPTPAADDKLHGKPIHGAVASRDIADDVSRALQSLEHHPVTPGAIATDESTVLGPDAGQEWHDRDTANVQIVPGTLRADEYRVGTVGRVADKATVAYWVGNLTALLPASPGVAAGRVRLRGTFIFEKRDGRWVVVQAHVSAPIEDLELATAVFGTALVSLDPLRVTCDDGSPASPSRAAGATVLAPQDPAPAAAASPSVR